MNPTVQAVAWTHFEAPPDVPWATDTDGGQALAEFAGRACYQSWSKPNPATATNAGYLAHILEVGHLSVLEHATVTLYLTGVSRSFTHELIRHRHLSYSQLSQRYVPAGGSPMVEPEVIAGDPYLHNVFTAATDAARTAYQALNHALTRKYGQLAAFGEHQATTFLPAGSSGVESCRVCDRPWPCRPARTAAQKLARQAARSVLPNATETRIVVTGNYRAWRHFIDIRATADADVEIRDVAVLVLRVLRQVAPNVFADYEIVDLPDGTQAARSPHREQS